MVANDSMPSGGTMEKLSHIETALSELSAEILSENLELINHQERNWVTVSHPTVYAESRIRW
jgi:hypothetical protein